LEIGFANGASARMWEEYFPNARLYYIDIQQQCIDICNRLLLKRSSCHLVDQGKKEDLLNFITTIEGEFDIIIDDGGHTMQQQITSFKALFPFIKKGGFYIIEDLHTSYWGPEHGNYGGYGSPKHPLAGPGTTIRFLQNLIDDINFRGASDYQATNLSFYAQHIYTLLFYPSLCVIGKI
jgi:hypothetical protein